MCTDSETKSINHSDDFCNGDAKFNDFSIRWRQNYKQVLPPPIAVSSYLFLANEFCLSEPREKICILKFTMYIVQN